MHKISVKGPEGEITCGQNVKIMIDGKELQGITRLEIIQEPMEAARVKIEMMGELDIDVETLKVFHREPEVLKIMNGMGQEIGEVIV